MEIRASELWRQVKTEDWRRALTFQGRRASASLAVNAAFVFKLHETRLPRHLLGDLRTPKSNAMKCAADPQRRRRLRPGNQPWRALEDLNDADFANPNKGAARSKRLALWGGYEVGYAHHPKWAQGWRQTFQIERWTRENKQRSEVRSQRSEFQSRIPVHNHFVLCPRCKTKHRKLFMVLAHEQEMNDAELAEGWIKMFDARLAASRRRSFSHDPELEDMRSKLIARYAPLFRDHRVFRCRACLGVRYGEVRKERRESAERGARQRAEARAHAAAQRTAARHAEQSALLQQLAPQIPPEPLAAAQASPSKSRKT